MSDVGRQLGGPRNLMYDPSLLWELETLRHETQTVHTMKPNNPNPKPLNFWAKKPRYEQETEIPTQNP